MFEKSFWLTKNCKSGLWTRKLVSFPGCKRIFWRLRLLHLLKSNLTQGSKAVFAALCGSNLWSHSASLLAVLRNVLRCTCNHAQWWCHQVLQFTCTPLQQGKRLNHLRAAKTRFPEVLNYSLILLIWICWHSSLHFHIMVNRVFV